MIRTVAAALVFFGVIGWWGGARLMSADGGVANVAPPAPAATTASAASLPAAATPAIPARAPTGTGTSESAAATAAPDNATSAAPAKPDSPPTTAASGAAPAPAAPTAAPALTDDQQIALQQQLEALGKTYLKALQANDTATISGMLAGRCAGTDVAALMARRRAEVAANAGTAIEQIIPLNQFVGHFDAGAGEAHTVLQWSFKGQRGQTSGADGWLLEGGVWKSAVCG